MGEFTWCVVGAILVASCIAMQHLKVVEMFSADASTTQWVTDNALLVPLQAPAKNIHTFDVTRWPEILKIAPGLPIDLVRSASGESRSTILVVDPQDAKAHYSGRPQLLMPRGYFVACTSLKNGLGMECGYAWVGKTIGYTDRASLLLILSLLHGHRISPKAVRLVNVPPFMWKKLDKILDTTLQILVTYVVPNTAHLHLLIRQDINIMGFQRMSEERLRLTMPTVTVETVDLAEMVSGAHARVLARERTSKLPSLQMVAVVLNGPTPTSVTEGFESSPAPALTQEPPSPPKFEERIVSTEPEFTCYGDDTIMTPTACESPFDVSGFRKPFQTTWDRKCAKNDDCSYYTGGDRGGCDVKTGMCELPVGTRRLSYRKATTRTPFQPFCWNAKPWDLTGCKNVSNPKWAFANETGYIDLRDTANEILNGAAAAAIST